VVTVVDEELDSEDANDIGLDSCDACCVNEASEEDRSWWPPCIADEERPLDPSSAVWHRGLVYVCDGDVVRVIDPKGGKVFRLAGGGSDTDVADGPAKLACFRGVSGLAIDETGLWFGDTGAGTVHRLHFSSDSVSTLTDGLPGVVAMVRDGTALYVACRQGELFEIDTDTAERRPLEAARDALVTGLALVERTVYVTTAAGLVLGVDRASRKVTQRLELEGTPYSVVRHPLGPWLYVASPGRIERLLVPDGSLEQLTPNGAVTLPRALAPVRTYNKSASRFWVPGLYFFDGGNLCWLDRLNNVVTTVLARSR
jgi:hypothetical protein